MHQLFWPKLLNLVGGVTFLNALVGEIAILSQALRLQEQTFPVSH